MMKVNQIDPPQAEESVTPSLHYSNCGEAPSFFAV